MLDPVSPAKLLLLSWLLTATGLFAVRLTRRFIGVREPLDIAGFGLAFSILILGVAGSWMARVTHSMAGTFIGLAALVSLPRLADLRRGFAGQPKGATSGRERPGSSAGGAILDRRERLFAIALGVLVLLPPLTVIWKTHLWDDWDYYLPLTSAFSRGAVPVVYPFLPDRPLTYHFGFAWLAGVTEYFTGISPEHCLDIVSTAMLVAFYLSASATVRLSGSGRLAPHVAAAMAIGFGPLGWLWAAFQEGAPRSSRLWAWVMDSQTTFSNGISSPTDYLLQKPMLAGMALIWTSLALLGVARRRASIAGATAAGICLGMVELFQFPIAVLGGLAGGAILGLDVLLARSPRRKHRLLMLVGYGLSAAIIAPLNGGFAANPQGDPIHMDRVRNFPFDAISRYAAGHELSTWLCYVGYYGASSVILIFVLPSLWRQRSTNALWLGMVALAAFLIPHLFQYRSSPINITKFFQLSAFALAGLSALGLTVASRRWPVALRASVMGACLVAVSLSTSMACFQIANPVSGGVVDAATISSLRRMARWLRSHAGTSDRAFALSDDVAAMSGIASPLPPDAPGGRQRYTVLAHGYAPDYVATMQGLTDGLARSLDESTLRRLEIRWVVLPVPLPAAVGTEARRRLDLPDVFQLRHQTSPAPGGWFIYEYLKG